MNKDKIIDEFQRIKQLGFIKSNRRHNTGIGKTFEDYLGVVENNIKDADYEGFEVKSQRALTSSYLTLFTKSPSSPRNANTHLKDSYGEAYEEYPDLKKIHTSIFSNRYNTYRGIYGFKIVNDFNNKKVVLEVKDLVSGQIIDDQVYWTYTELELCLHSKLEALFYVNADTKIEDDEEYFHYTKATIYINPSLEKLLRLIDDGKLMIDIRIGSYKSGKKKGKTHDHGTGFRIKPSELSNLYEEVVIL